LHEKQKDQTKVTEDRQKKKKKTKKYNQKKIKKHIRHKHSTDDGGQAMGEDMRHEQMNRSGKHTGEGS